jgi:voltage-gated potassium channel
MKDLIIKLAYSLEASKNYCKFKKFFYRLLEDNNAKQKKYFDFFMIFLVLSTVAILIYEVNHQALPWLSTYETIATIVFIIEWLIRLWISSHMRLQIIEDYEKTQLLNQPFNALTSIKKIIKQKLQFIFSPMSIVDLLAILPYYRPLRILRILMLFRVFKLLRYINSIKQFKHVFIEKKFEFFTLIIMFMMAIIFGSTIIFIYEGSGINKNIHSFFDAVYWSIITISTVGFGDITPVTIQGKIATLFLVIGGMGVIAFFTSIVTASLSGKLIALKEEKVIGEANALENFVIICGFGRMGEILAEELIKVKQKFVIIEQNIEAFEQASIQNYLVIRGDATNSNLLANVGINNTASTIIALTDDDATNLAIILTARSQNPNIDIIARANQEDTKEKLIIAGANHVILSNEIASLVASEYIGQPVAFEVIDDILLNNEGAIMDEIEILDNSYYINYYLKDIDLSKFNLTLIGIIDSQNRKKFTFNPNKQQYKIKAKDILIVIGYKDSITKLKVELLSAKPSKRLQNG